MLGSNPVSIFFLASLGEFGIKNTDKNPLLLFVPTLKTEEEKIKEKEAIKCTE